MSYCSRSRRRRFAVLDFKSWAYICTYGYFQQHLYMHRNGYLWTSCVNLDTTVRFAIKVLNFGDLATFSVDFCILYSQCPPYFYFRSVQSTDLQSVPHTSTPTSIIPTKFEVDMCIHCWVIAFLSADPSRDHVTLTSDLLTLNSCSVWRVTWPTLPPS